MHHIFISRNQYIRQYIRVQTPRTETEGHRHCILCTTNPKQQDPEQDHRLAVTSTPRLPLAVSARAAIEDTFHLHRHSMALEAAYKSRPTRRELKSGSGSSAGEDPHRKEGPIPPPWLQLAGAAKISEPPHALSPKQGLQPQTSVAASVAVAAATQLPIARSTTTDSGRPDPCSKTAPGSSSAPHPPPNGRGGAGLLLIPPAATPSAMVTAPGKRTPKPTSIYTSAQGSPFPSTSRRQNGHRRRRGTADPPPEDPSLASAFFSPWSTVDEREREGSGKWDRCED
jgi:hypothetical protein